MWAATGARHAARWRTGARGLRRRGADDPRSRDGRYRESTLGDLYDAARLVDSLEHLHFFSRSLVARDMPDLHSLDINTAYACLAGTSKHVFTSASLAAHVGEIADICFTIAGSREAFLQRPFLSLNINPPVPPMRFDADSCEVLAEAARLGIPVHSNTFGQMGASSPVTIAGTVAQTIAETLSGMIFAWLVNPGGENYLRYATTGNRFAHRGDERRQWRGCDYDGGERADGELLWPAQLDHCRCHRQQARRRAKRLRKMR